MVGYDIYVIITLLQISAVYASEIISKIGQYLAKIWTKVSWPGLISSQCGRMFHRCSPGGADMNFL